MLPTILDRSEANIPGVDLLTQWALKSKTYPNGNIGVNKVRYGMKGVRDMKSDFIIDRLSKDSAFGAAQFAAEDNILQAIYYSGLGGARHTNETLRAIQNAEATPEAKKYAEEQLRTIITILQKYMKKDGVEIKKQRGIELETEYDGIMGRYQGAAQNTGKDGILGFLPESLVNPKEDAEEAVKDFYKLQEASVALSSWFGSSEGSPLVPLIGKSDPKLQEFKGIGRGESYREAKLPLFNNYTTDQIKLKL